MLIQIFDGYFPLVSRSDPEPITAPDVDDPFVHACDLLLHKPLSARVASFILQTPAWRKNTRSFHPVFVISGIHLASGAALQDRVATDFGSSTCDFCLYTTDVGGAEEPPSDDHVIETSLALLTLLALQTHRMFAGVLDQNSMSRRTRRCKGTWEHVPHHVEFTLGRASIEGFIDRVSRKISSKEDQSLTLSVLPH
jgi:hypothetical protein